ncbi:UNVERIFIED_CONTAM: hypothetical protein NCL1_18642 [Trichonephila clavipes]
MQPIVENHFRAFSIAIITAMFSELSASFDLPKLSEDAMHCNRTFYGEANVKYPLRVTGPFQRYLPFVCKITFVAAGKEFGDFVELTFLSFQIGRLELTRTSSNPQVKRWEF